MVLEVVCVCGSGPPLAGSARISMLARAFLKKGGDVSRIGLVLCLFNEQETDFSTNGWLPDDSALEDGCVWNF